MAHNTKSNPAPPKIQQRFTPSGRHGRRQERAWYSANRYFPDPLGSFHCADLNIFTGMAGGKSVLDALRIVTSLTRSVRSIVLT